MLCGRSDSSCRKPLSAGAWGLPPIEKTPRPCMARPSAGVPLRPLPVRHSAGTARRVRRKRSTAHFSKKMRHACAPEIERTAPRYPATAQKSAGSVKLFYAFHPETDGLSATTCHACPLPRSRLRCAAAKRGAPTVLLKLGSGQMMLPMTPADGKTERNGRKRQALLRRQHGHDRRQHGLLSEIQGHDWPKHATDDPNTPRAHIGHTAGRKIAQTQPGTAPGRSKALHDVKKTNGAPPCHAATHREVCGKKNVILP